jgi:hypothetical protein
MLTRTRITNPEITGSAVLAMVLDEMQARGLTNLKPDEDKKPSDVAELQTMWPVEDVCV